MHWLLSFDVVPIPARLWSRMACWSSALACCIWSCSSGPEAGSWMTARAAVLAQKQRTKHMRLVPNARHICVAASVSATNERGASPFPHMHATPAGAGTAVLPTCLSIRVECGPWSRRALRQVREAVHVQLQVALRLVTPGKHECARGTAGTMEGSHQAESNNATPNLPTGVSAGINAHCISWTRLPAVVHKLTASPGFRSLSESSEAATAP